MISKIFAALLTFIVVSWPIPTTFCEEGSRYLYVSTYIYENRGGGAYNLTDDDATVPLFPRNSWQTVRIYNTTHTVGREYVDIDGNSLAILDLPSTIPPNSSLMFSVTYLIESSDRSKPDIDPSEAAPLSSIPSKLVKEFLVETETFAIDDEEIKKLASRLAENETTVLGIVGRLLDWLIENVSYSYWEVPRYPNETLAEGMGDCDDQAILLITMCRAMGIPAILQVGVVFHEGIESDRSSWGGHLHIKQRGVGWHGWALVYIPPWGWLPIDMTLLTSRDLLLRITEAPEYERHIVTCYNVSRQEYIGDGRRSRELLMSSDLYVTVSDMVIEESPSAVATEPPYLIIGLSIGSAAVIIIFILRRRGYERSRIA